MHTQDHRYTMVVIQTYNFMMFWGPVHSINDGIYIDENGDKKLDFQRIKFLCSIYVICIAFYNVGLQMLKH